MKQKILVVGSSNTDMVVKADHLPAAGETILGGTFFMNPGGKGANQAVTAARLGAEVTFICKTGNDIFGRQAVKLFEEEGINTAFMCSDLKHPSGVALITVDANGENCIVVASGANATLSPMDIQKAQAEIMQATIVLMQLEISIETVEYVAQAAADKNIKVVLNPAPACSLSDQLLKNLYIITPNKMEAEILSGIKVADMTSAQQAASIIHSKGVAIVVITLGAQGALLLENDHFDIIPAMQVEAVDTTAAGDVFNGALVVALSEGMCTSKAVEFACKASAISVTRSGAQLSVPYRNEVELISENRQ